MEGLIPFVYKTIKRSVSHRHYKCLSTTGGADFYLHDLDDRGDHLSLSKYYLPSPEARSSVSDIGFRRCNSSVSRMRYADDKAGGFGGNPDGKYLDHPTRKRQLVRFRSHRRMFSCISGF